MVNTGGTNNRVYNVSAGATLTFSADHSHTNGALIEGLGTVNFSAGNQNISGIVTVSAPLNVLNAGSRVNGVGELRITGLVSWRGNAEMTESGRTVFTSTSVVTLDGVGGGASFFRPVDNYGTVNWSGGVIHLAPWVTFTNRSDAMLGTGTIHASYSGGSTGFVNGTQSTIATVNNEGIFNRTGNASSSDLRAPESFPVTLNNTGTVRVEQGSLSLNPSTFFQQSGNTLTGGEYIIRGSATLSIPGAAFTTIGAAASVTLDGPGATFSNINSITTINGTFRLGAGRNFTTAGALTNTGTLDIGTSLLSVAGNYTQSAAGRLRLAIEGDAVGQFGRLQVNGAASLAGALDVSIHPQYKVRGVALRVLSAASRTGSFGTMSPQVGANYDPTGLSITVLPIQSAAVNPV